MTYNPQGKRITSENLAGQVTTTAWNQYVCNPVDELISGAKLGGSGSVPAAGDTATRLYGDGWWMIASSCLCGRHWKPNSFLALLHFAADGEGHYRKNRSGQPEIAQTGVQAGMSYCINLTVSISSNPSGSKDPTGELCGSNSNSGGFIQPTPKLLQRNIVARRNNPEPTIDLLKPYRGKIVVCPQMMSQSNMISRHGGCGCFIMHELMHRYGMTIPQDKSERDQFELPIENSMIEIQRYVLRELNDRKCKGYDVK